MKIRFAIGIIFLLMQLFSVVYARFIPERFFCWAPYDQHTYYEIFVEINGEKLGKMEIKERYHYNPGNWEVRSISNVFNIISQYESTYGKNDNARVKVKYSINGHEESTWVLNY